MTALRKRLLKTATWGIAVANINEAKTKVDGILEKTKRVFAKRNL